MKQTKCKLVEPCGAYRNQVKHSVTKSGWVEAKAFYWNQTKMWGTKIQVSASEIKRLQVSRGEWQVGTNEALPPPNPPIKFWLASLVFASSRRSCISPCWTGADSTCSASTDILITLWQSLSSAILPEEPLQEPPSSLDSMLTAERVIWFHSLKSVRAL